MNRKVCTPKKTGRSPALRSKVLNMMWLPQAALHSKVLTILKACGFKGKAIRCFAKKEKGNPIFRIAFLRDYCCIN